MLMITVMMMEMVDQFNTLKVGFSDADDNDGPVQHLHSVGFSVNDNDDDDGIGDDKPVPRHCFRPEGSVSQSIAFAAIWFSCLAEKLWCF